MVIRQWRLGAQISMPQKKLVPMRLLSSGGGIERLQEFAAQTNMHFETLGTHLEHKPNELTADGGQFAIGLQEKYPRIQGGKKRPILEQGS
jgi:hypothetical protein